MNISGKLPQKGVALVVSLLLLFVISALGIAAIGFVKSEARSGGNYARYLESETDTLSIANYANSVFSDPVALQTMLESDCAPAPSCELWNSFTENLNRNTHSVSWWASTTTSAEPLNLFSPNAYYFRHKLSEVDYQTTFVRETGNSSNTNNNSNSHGNDDSNSTNNNSNSHGNDDSNNTNNNSNSHGNDNSNDHDKNDDKNSDHDSDDHEDNGGDGDPKGKISAKTGKLYAIELVSYATQDESKFPYLLKLYKNVFLYKIKKHAHHDDHDSHNDHDNHDDHDKHNDNDNHDDHKDSDGHNSGGHSGNVNT